MLGRLALLFVLIPLVELALLIQLGGIVGFWPTLGLVILTGIAGAALARAEGLRTLAAFQRELAGGALPGQALFDGLAILVGGAFLLTPGLLTDVAGFALLLPPSRRLLQKWVRRWLESQIESGQLRVMVWGGGFGGPGGPGPSPGPGSRELDPRHEIEVERIEVQDLEDTGHVGRESRESPGSVR